MAAMAADTNNLIIKLVLNGETTYIKIRYQERSHLSSYFKDFIENNGQILVTNSDLSRSIPFPELPAGCDSVKLRL
jgi:hypothetical protein